MSSADSQTDFAAPRDRRLLVTMIGLGLAAVGTLIVVPFETILPPEIEVPRAVLLIQPAVIVVLMAVLGWWATARTGLAAPVLGAALRGLDWRAPLWRAVPVAVVTAAGVALILIVFGRATQGVDLGMPELELPLLARVGYGGVGEEIIARWGLLTGLMALALRFNRSRSTVFWLANSVSALLFAFGHFGVLFAMLPDPPLWLLSAVLLGNFFPAMAFGWLYRKFGIESAMIAHGGAHALFVAAAWAGLA